MRRGWSGDLEREFWAWRRQILQSRAVRLATILENRGGRRWPYACVLEDVAADARRFVYVLRSTSDPTRHYVGLTSDVHGRLASHNAGLSPHTAKYGPWSLSVCVEFADQDRAIRFEKYLKSGSGRAFAKRHLA